MARGANIGTLSAKGTLDAQGFSLGVKKMEEDAKRGAANVEKAFGKGGLEGKLEGIFGRMGANLRLGGGLSLGFENITSAFGIGGLTGVAQKLGTTLDEEIDLGFLNDRLGTSVQWLSTLRTVAGETSISAQQLSGGLDFLNRFIGQAATGSEEARTAFSRLGIQWSEIRGQRFEQVFSRVADGFASITDRSTRASLAMQMFGRGEGQRMLRLFEGGGEGLSGAMEDARRRGGFVTAEDMARANQLNEAMDRATTAWNNAWRRFLSEIAPAAATAINGITDAMRAGRERFNPPAPQIGVSIDTMAGVPPWARAQVEAARQQRRDNEAAFIEAYMEAEAAARAEEAVAGRVDEVTSRLEEQASAWGMTATEAQRAKLAAEGATDAQLAGIDAIIAREQERVRAGRDAEQLMRLQNMASTPLDALRSRITDIQRQGNFMTDRQRGAALMNAIGGLNMGESPLLGGLSASGTDTAQIIQGAMSPQVDQMAAMEAALEGILEQSRRSNELWDAAGLRIQEIADRLTAIEN